MLLTAASQPATLVKNTNTMGIFGKVFDSLVGKKDCRILMVGLDAAGKHYSHVSSSLVPLMPENIQCAPVRELTR